MFRGAVGIDRFPGIAVSVASRLLYRWELHDAARVCRNQSAPAKVSSDALSRGEECW